MILSFLLLLIFICGIFLLLYAAVALIQNKKFFSSAPKEAREKIQDHSERFPYQHVLGWLLAIVAVCMILFAFLYGAYDGVKNDFSFLQFFLRYLILLDGYKVWDMLFLDRYLLTKSGFFEHYYPEVTGTLGMKQTGFNNKSQFLKLFLVFPIVSGIIAFLLSLL